jgi:hypothetical protein
MLTLHVPGAVDEVRASTVFEYNQKSIALPGNAPPAADVCLDEI